MISTALSNFYQSRRSIEIRLWLWCKFKLWSLKVIIYQILTVVGVLNSLAAIEGGSSLQDLKTENPILVCEVMRDHYVLIDGNHRIVIQWNDVNSY